MTIRLRFCSIYYENHATNILIYMSHLRDYIIWIISRHDILLRQFFVLNGKSSYPLMKLTRVIRHFQTNCISRTGITSDCLVTCWMEKALIRMEDISLNTVLYDAFKLTTLADFSVRPVHIITFKLRVSLA